MKKIWSMLFVFLFPALLCTGCKDLTEPEAAGLVTVLGFHLTDDNQYEIIAQDESLTPGGQQMQNSNWTFDIHKATGHSIYDAIQNISRSDPEEVYLSHTKVIILSEELAESESIEPVIDFLERNPKMRQNSLFLISKKGEFEKVFLPNAKINTDTGKAIEKLIKENSSYTFIADSKIKDFFVHNLEPYCTPYALGIWSKTTSADNHSIEQNYNNTQTSTYDIEVGDIAVFNNGAMVGWLSDDESKGLMLAKGNAKGGYIDITYEGEKLTLSISNIKSKLKPVIVGGALKVNMNISVEADIGNSDGDIDFEDKTVIKNVEQALEDQIKEEISEAFNKSKSISADIFEIGSSIFKNQPKYWKQIESQWNDDYPNLDINIQVSANIQHIGLVKKSS